MIKIKIDIKGQETELTLEEAKELRNQLNEVFGRENPNPFIPWSPPMPEPYPHRNPLDPPWGPVTVGPTTNTITVSKYETDNDKVLIAQPDEPPEVEGPPNPPRPKLRREVA